MSAQNGSKVTEGNSVISTGAFRPSPSERETAVIGGETLHSPMTEREGGRPIRRALAWLKGEFGWPRPLTDRAPAVKEIRQYAHEAAGSDNPDGGPVRALALAWCYLVAVPVTIWSRLREWVWLRPARAIVVALVVKLLSELPPVEWFVENVIKPGVEFALWLFI